MSGNDAVRNALLRQTRDARLGGAAEAALPLVATLLRRFPGDAEVRDEALRILLLTGHEDQAFRLLSEGGIDVPPPPEVAARIALALGLEMTIDGVPEGIAWLQELAATGADPVAAFRPDSLHVNTDGGRLVYRFDGACPHCGHRHARPLTATLLVRQLRPCPACFGPVLVESATLRSFLHERYGRLLDRPYVELEGAVGQRVADRLLGTAALPAVVDGMGQGYHFLLNELMMRCALADDDGRPA